MAQPPSRHVLRVAGRPAEFVAVQALLGPQSTDPGIDASEYYDGLYLMPIHGVDSRIPLHDQPSSSLLLFHESARHRKNN